MLGQAHSSISVKASRGKQTAITSFFEHAEVSIRKRRSSANAIDDSSHSPLMKRQKANRPSSESNAGDEESWGDTSVTYSCFADESGSNLINGGRKQVTAESKSANSTVVDENQLKRTCPTNANGISGKCDINGGSTETADAPDASTAMPTPETLSHSDLQIPYEQSGKVETSSLAMLNETGTEGVGLIPNSFAVFARSDNNRNLSSPAKSAKVTKNGSSEKKQVNLSRAVDQAERGVGSSPDVDMDESSSDSLDLSYLLTKASESGKHPLVTKPSPPISEKSAHENAEKKLKNWSFMPKNEIRRVQEYVGQKNTYFYSNKIASSPNGAKIEDLLMSWKGDYSKLEQHHGYIQWLFPIPQAGLNRHAQPLTVEEARFIRTNEEAKCRLKRAFCLMLDFFGMELVVDRDDDDDDDDEKEKCTVKRAKNWKERFAHLNRYSHNYLRITRILKCLVEVGQVRLQESFVRYLVDEVFVKSTLSSCRRSCVDFWLPTVTNVQLRDELRRVIRTHRT